MYDLKKALDINPKNSKNLTRLANIHTMTGNLGEAEMLLQKCVNIDSKDPSHAVGLNKVRTHMSDYEKLLEGRQKEDYVKCEELGQKILKECTEFTSVKIIYIEALLDNVKLTEAIKFLASKLNDEEKNNEEFDYLLTLAFYYDGK